MNSRALKQIGRSVWGRPFSQKKLETEFRGTCQATGARVVYLYIWLAAFSLIQFSLIEYALYARPLIDSVTLVRAGLVGFFALLGWAIKRHESALIAHYSKTNIVCVMLICGAIYYIEYLSQVPTHPEFLYVSVTAMCLIFLMGIYGFLRLPVWHALGLGIFAPYRLICACTRRLIRGWACHDYLPTNWRPMPPGFYSIA